MRKRALRFLAVSALESEAHVWVGLLRDKDLSLRSTWLADVHQAVEHIALTKPELVICTQPPETDLIRACAEAQAILLLFVDCSAHQAASWLGLGAYSVMPKAQIAALIPLTLRALTQQQQLASARQNTALKSEHEARLNLLLQRSGMALAYLSDTHFLSVSDGWARWLGSSIEHLSGQRWIQHLPDSIRDDFHALLTQAQLGDGIEAAVTLNEMPRRLRIEPATYSGQPCLMATLTAPSNKNAGVGVSARASDGGITRTLQALHAHLENGAAQTLVLSEIKNIELLRRELSLVDFAELMGLVQACMGSVFDLPPEPVNDHSFMLAIPADGQTCASLGDKLHQQLAQGPLAGNLPMVELGLALVPVQADDGDVGALLQRGYDLAGQTEPGQTQTFQPSTLELADKDPLAALQQALARNQCELLYQPLVSLTAKPGEYYEVLTQLRDEQGDVIPARTFIRDAGRGEIGRTLDGYITSQAAQSIVQHLPSNPDTRLILNLTLASLQASDLAHWLQSLTLGIHDPTAIVWQFRETDIALDIQTAALHLKTLKGLGYQIGCAQFGNLPDGQKLLNQCQFDWVKLDPSFVEGIKHNPEKQSELAQLCETVHQVGAGVIVPMVEEAAVMSALYRAGADMIQGHYLQPPASRMSFEFATEI